MNFEIPFTIIRNTAADDIIIAVVAFAFAIMVSGEAQGYMLYLLGYSDPEKNKRIMSFNPLAHLDPFGFAAYILCGFGWPRRHFTEKPVEKKLHLFLLHLSGPVANLLFANIVGSILYVASRIAEYLGEEKALSILLIANLSVGFYGLLLPVPPMPMGNLLRGLFKLHGHEKLVYPVGILIIAAIFAMEYLTGSQLISGPINSVITWAYMLVIP